MIELPDPLTLILVLSLLSLAPFLTIMLTSFVKIVVVLFLIRNAMGIQQIPPNMAINGLALIMSIFVMAPVGLDTYDAMVGLGEIKLDTTADLEAVVTTGMGPIRDFLDKHAEPREREFFMQSAIALWPAERAAQLTPNSLLILIPAFTVSELTSAFKIGFLLYLPFIVIDLIISNILLAMGMMMVSPMTISLPFKLLLFVLLDGWSRLLQGLVLSYQ